MARSKTNNPVTLGEDTPLDTEGLSAAQNLMGAVRGEYSDERDLLNQLLGQAQMASAFAKFSETVSTSKLAYVKENKLYRAIKGQKSGNGFGFLTGTWEEFCGLLGVTSRKVDEDISNLQSFGEEALESMSRIGIGYRELRQYRRLPDDQKLALIEVAKAGDKEAFVDLAEEIIARHAREKETLQQKADDTAANYQAQAEVLSDKNAKIDKLSAELRKAKRRVADTPHDEVGVELAREVAGYAIAAEAAVRGDLRKGVEALVMHSDVEGKDSKAIIHGFLLQVERAVNEIRAEFDVPYTLDAEVLPGLVGAVTED